MTMNDEKEEEADRAKCETCGKEWISVKEASHPVIISQMSNLIGLYYVKSMTLMGKPLPLVALRPIENLSRHTLQHIQI